MRLSKLEKRANKYYKILEKEIKKENKSLLSIQDSDNES